MELELQALFDNHSKVIPVLLRQLCINSLIASSNTCLNIQGSECESHHITDDIITAILDCLTRQHIILNELCLKFHRITSIGLIEISKYIYSSNEHALAFKILDLEGNDIDGESIDSLRMDHADICKIESLNVSSNPLGRVGASKIALALTANTSLQHLIINNCSFPLTSVIEISTSMGSRGNRSISSAIQTLELDRPLMRMSSIKEEDGSNHLSRLITLIANSPLKRLSFKYHNMQDLGAQLISDSLCCSVNNISHLNLERNFIGIRGAESLAQCLLKFPGVGLRVLKLSYNCIGNEGAAAIAEALKSNYCLEELTLKNNSISDGLISLGNALEINSSLKRISLFGNSFDQLSGSIFHGLIQNRLPYTGTQADFNVYVVDGIYQIAEIRVENYQ